MATGSGLFAFLGRGFVQIFGQILSIRVMTLINTNVVASRLIKREMALLPVAVRRSKTVLNFICGNENETETKASRIPSNLYFPGEMEFSVLNIRVDAARK